MPIPKKPEVEKVEEDKVIFCVNYRYCNEEPDITITRNNNIYATCRGVKKALELALELGKKIERELKK